MSACMHVWVCGPGVSLDMPKGVHVCVGGLVCLYACASMHAWGVGGTGRGTGAGVLLLATNRLI